MATPIADLDASLKTASQRRMYLRVNLYIIAALFVISIPAVLLYQSIGSGVIRFGLQRFFHNIELSIPTLYNFSLIALNFGLLVMLAAVTWARGARGALHWAALAVIFLLMSYDEAVQLHEELARFLRDFVPESPFLIYPWTIVGAIFVIGVAVVYWPFLRALPRQVSRLMILAGVLYVSGAIIVETAGGYVDFTQGQTLVFHILSGVEESLEMAGMAVFGYALLTYLATPWSPSVG